jgi:hypothetical protein
MAPMGKPITVPRSQLFQDRAQSCAVIQSEPFTATASPSRCIPRPATNSASPTAKSATASVVTSIPSSSCGTPKESRACPVSWSMPTTASASPMKSEVSPRSVLSPKAAETVTKASTISAKYSRGPKTSASLTTVGAISAKAMVARSPATKEPMAAVASAGPPLPARAILLPSSAVTIEALSPGVLSRIEVVEPPYMPP